MEDISNKIAKSLKTHGYELTVQNVIKWRGCSISEAAEIADNFISENPNTPIFKHAKKTKILSAVILIGLCVIILVGCVKCFLGDEDSKQFKIEDMKNEAYIISTRYIESYLKAPSTADFPNFSGMDHTRYLGDSMFVVNSYVDAQNGFGAMIRTSFYCKLKYKGGDWVSIGNWELVDAKLIE